MKNYQLVFDLGSQYISAGTKEDGFFDKIPTIVALGGASGKEVVAVGMDALRMFNTTNGGVKLSRPILEGAVIDSDGVKALVKRLLLHVVNGKTALSKYSILCAVPCGMISSDKKNIETLFLEMGAKQVAFVEAPLANSYKLFSEFRTRQGIVMDIGYDCVDIAVVTADTILSGCTLYYGGKNLTEEIVKRIREKYMVQLSFEQADHLKVNGASLYPNDATVVSVVGQNTESGRVETISVSSREIYDILVNFAKKYLQIVQSLLSSISEDTRPLIKNSGVMICGGGAKLAGLDMYLQSQLNIPVKIADNPEDTTINGLLLK